METELKRYSTVAALAQIRFTNMIDLDDEKYSFQAL
jgi:hypothetical protein